jgi:exonuclease VII large subunit
MAAATSWAGADADYAYAEHVLASLAPPPPPSGAAEMDAAPAEPGSISPPVKPRNAKAEETEDALSPTEKRRLDQRRKRNREAMQRARQRSKDYMDGLREQARALEQTHNGLLASLNEQVARFAGVATASERVLALRAQLDDARAQAQALMAQNLRFQEQIDERIKREDRMEGLLRELIVRALRRVRGSVARRVY